MTWADLEAKWTGLVTLHMYVHCIKGETDWENKAQINASGQKMFFEFWSHDHADIADGIVEAATKADLILTDVVGTPE